MRKVSRFSGLLIDVQLPDGNGIAVLRSFRDEGCFAPAVIITGFDDRATVDAAFDLRARLLLKGDGFDWRLHEFLRDAATPLEARLEPRLRGWAVRYRFTPTEVAILRSAALGMLPEQVTLQLRITQGTRRNHVKHILAKTGDVDLMHAVLRLVTET